MNKWIVLIFLTAAFESFSQEKVTASRLGFAEKVWVLLHPFSANKAKKLTKEAIAVADSLHLEEKFPHPQSGGRKDAFRHAYWMALISYHIGSKRALSLGRAHEKKNRKDFERGRLEGGLLPDQASREMDLFNNSFGVKIGKFCVDCTNKQLLDDVLYALRSGELRIIKRNTQGDFLNIENDIISPNSIEGKWENDKVLISSAY